MSDSDPELLKRFAQHGCEEAFATLVQRHLDLVYSAARRQVRSPELAEEVAQSVFLDLARSARHLKPGTPLVAWLYVVTRRTAIDALRRESRRQIHERAAAEIAAMSSEPSAWSQIEPLLDDAMASLPGAERTALLLRFFENKNLREVGAALGASENAAQKRVSRALEQLRAFFLQRGITTSALTLAGTLSVHAAPAAPTGLGASIAAAAAAASTFSAPAAAATTLAMTTAQKIFVAASLTLALGGGLHQASALARQAERLHTLESRATELNSQLGRLQREHEAATRALAALPAKSGPSSAAPAAGRDAALEAEMHAWMERAVQLKLLLADRPEHTIPEMRQFLSEEDIFDHALTAKFGSETEIRETLANLRHYARNAFGNRLPEALRAYLTTHGNELPAHPRELLSHFEPAIDPAILERYRMTATGKLDALPPRQRRGTLIEETAAVDEIYDSRLEVDADGFSLGAFDHVAASTRSALRKFRSAHGNASPASPEALLPYFDPPLRPAEQQTFLEKAGRYLAP